MYVYGAIFLETRKIFSHWWCVAIKKDLNWLEKFKNI